MVDILRRNNPGTLRTEEEDAAVVGIPDIPEAVAPAPEGVGIPAVEGMEIRNLINKLKKIYKK